MNLIEETIDATLDSNGQLRLTHQPRLPPGPVRVTIRAAAPAGAQRGLADVIREIAAEQRSRGFPGRSADDVSSENDASLAEDTERDRELVGHQFSISELTLTECLVPVLGPGGGQRLSDFFRFFRGPNLRTLGLTTATHVRASAIRGGHTYPAVPPALPTRYGLADALHLAAAIEFGCDVFLTNDHQLDNFPDIRVEVLP
jgi:hypothetical protein